MTINQGGEMKKWMVLILGAAAIFIVGNYLLLNNEEGKKREVKIVQEYQNIKHPEGSKLVNYELTRKVVIRSIHSRFVYPITNDEIKKYYDQELTSNGWNQVSISSKPGDTAYGYEKDNLRLMLGLNKDNSWTLSMGYPDAKY